MAYQNNPNIICFRYTDKFGREILQTAAISQIGAQKHAIRQIKFNPYGPEGRIKTIDARTRFGRHRRRRGLTSAEKKRLRAKQKEEKKRKQEIKKLRQEKKALKALKDKERRIAQRKEKQEKDLERLRSDVESMRSEPAIESNVNSVVSWI